MKILGIESSCDETAASVVRDGTHILSSVISSQVDVHRKYGGVVPELASRKHIEAIVPVVASAVKEAGIEMADIDVFAVTRGPGLIGSLLVGFSFTKALAWSLGKPWVGVDHLEGHVQSVFLTSNPPEFPFAALLVSGGHTAIYHVTSHNHMRFLGGTRDDAAGEAYDKVSKLLGLGYPGGPVIDRLAKTGDPGKISFPRVWLDKSGFDFSFSGLKTAVLRWVEQHSGETGEMIPHIAAGFQAAVVEVLAGKIVHAAEKTRCDHIAVVGGVAANQGLRSSVRDLAKKKGVTVHIPPVELCGDNAAMIAAAGYQGYSLGNTLPLNADVYSRSPVKY